MKAFVASIIILIFMIAGGIGSDMYLKNVSQKAEQYTQKLRAAAESEDFEQMNKVYEQYNMYWEKNKKFLTTLIDHQYTSEIDKAFAEIQAGLDEEESVEVMLAALRAGTIIKTVSDNEDIKISNIL